VRQAQWRFSRYLPRALASGARGLQSSVVAICSSERVGVGEGAMAFAERRSSSSDSSGLYSDPGRSVLLPLPLPLAFLPSTHADTTSPAVPAALAAVPSADFDAATAGVTSAAHSSVSVTRACAPATVLVAVFFITAAIILGFEWVILGSRHVCFGFGLIILRHKQVRFRC